MTFLKFCFQPARFLTNKINRFLNILLGRFIHCAFGRFFFHWVSRRYHHLFTIVANLPSKEGIHQSGEIKVLIQQPNDGHTHSFVVKVFGLMTFLNGIHQRCQHNTHHGNSRTLSRFRTTFYSIPTLTENATLIYQLVIDVRYFLITILLNIAQTAQAFLCKIP